MTTTRSIRRMLYSVTAMLSVLSLSFNAIAQQRMSGFSRQAAQTQKQIEEKFKRIPSAEEARKLHRYFTAEPHPAGSERNNELARHIAEQWKQQGWEDVQIHRYDVFSSYPREVSVEMTAPSHYKAALREDAYDVD